MDLQDKVDSISNNTKTILLAAPPTTETPVIKTRDIIKITRMVMAVAAHLTKTITTVEAMVVQNPCSRFLGIQVELLT